MPKPTTMGWAKSHNISILPTPPAIEDYNDPSKFTARQIGARALIVHGVVAVASGVNSEPVVEWLRDQGIWEFVSPNEKELLNDPTSLAEEVLNKFSGKSRLNGLCCG